MFLFISTSLAEQSTDSLSRFSYTQYHMGIDARLVVFAPSAKIAEDACTNAFQRIADLEDIMSDYRQDSELMLLCAKAGNGPVKVSRDLFKVLKRAQEISQRSAGAFDATVSPLVRLWRQARKTGQLPESSSIESARRLVGWEKMKLCERERTVALMVKGMQLDLGGIAKGYACDEAQKVLKKHGIRIALVEMGGDIVVTGPPPGKKGWTIRVPNAGDDQGPADLEFANCSISTSGDTEQFTVIGGVRYSHVVDPRTGMALTNRIQATVVAKDGLTSDPLSKLLALLGPEVGGRVLMTYPRTKSYVRVAGADKG
jgi:thiamine biosynthesis lipoprotein